MLKISHSWFRLKKELHKLGIEISKPLFHGCDRRIGFKIIQTGLQSGKDLGDATETKSICFSRSLDFYTTSNKALSWVWDKRGMILVYDEREIGSRLRSRPYNFHYESATDFGKKMYQHTKKEHEFEERYSSSFCNTEITIPTKYIKAIIVETPLPYEIPNIPIYLKQGSNYVLQKTDLSKALGISLEVDDLNTFKKYFEGKDVLDTFYTAVTNNSEEIVKYLVHSYPEYAEELFQVLLANRYLLKLCLGLLDKVELNDENIKRIVKSDYAPLIRDAKITPEDIVRYSTNTLLIKKYAPKITSYNQEMLDNLYYSDIRVWEYLDMYKYFGEKELYKAISDQDWYKSEYLIDNMVDIDWDTVFKKAVDSDFTYFLLKNKQHLASLSQDTLTYLIKYTSSTELLSYIGDLELEEDSIKLLFEGTHEIEDPSRFISDSRIIYHLSKLDSIDSQIVSTLTASLMVKMDKSLLDKMDISFVEENNRMFIAILRKEDYRRYLSDNIDFDNLVYSFLDLDVAFSRELYHRIKDFDSIIPELIRSSKYSDLEYLLKSKLVTELSKYSLTYVRGIRDEKFKKLFERYGLL